MKSYVLLLLASLPLFLAAYTQVDTLRVDIANTLRERSELGQASVEFQDVRKDVDLFKKVDPRLRLFAIGSGTMFDVKSPRKGPEEDLARGFEPYRKAIDAVRQFTEAFTNHQTLDSIKLVGARRSVTQLMRWLDDRSQRELIDQEKSLDEMVKNNVAGDERRQKATAYASLDVCNTELADSALRAPVAWDPSPTDVRKGTVLVLVIKTTELLTRDAAAARIEEIYQGLGDRKATLVAGTFVLVTNARNLKESRAPWRSRLTGSGDEFRPTSDPSNAFVKALDVARDIQALRGPDHPLGAVEIIWVSGWVNGSEAPRASGALDGVVRLKVGLNWVGPVGPDADRTANLGALLPWFAENVNPLDWSLDWSKALLEQLKR